MENVFTRFTLKRVCSQRCGSNTVNTRHNNWFFVARKLSPSNEDWGHRAEVFGGERPAKKRAVGIHKGEPGAAAITGGKKQGPSVAGQAIRLVAVFVSVIMFGTCERDMVAVYPAEHATGNSILMDSVEQMRSVLMSRFDEIEAIATDQQKQTLVKASDISE